MELSRIQCHRMTDSRYNVEIKSQSQDTKDGTFFDLRGEIVG